MTEFTRRSLLKGVAGAGAVVASPIAFSTLTKAYAPPIGKQVPSVYRYKVGSYECTSINDGVRTFPMPDGFVRNVSKDQALAAAEAAYFPKGMVRIPFNPQVINTGEKLVLIDTGYGPVPNVPSTPLAENLVAAGIDPKAIDVVVISHMHGDHILGLRTGDGALTFPNAEIKVPAADWAFWMNDDNMNKAQDGFTKGQFEFNRKIFSGLANMVTKYEWGKEVAPGITALDTHGHTPGHTSFAVASGSARVFIQSDITNIPELFMRNPEWHVMFDNDPQTAQQTRRKFYDIAAAEKALIVGYHFAFPSMGYVEKDGANYRLVPVAWNPVL